MGFGVLSWGGWVGDPVGFWVPGWVSWWDLGCWDGKDSGWVRGGELRREDGGPGRDWGVVPMILFLWFVEGRSETLQGLLVGSGSQTAPSNLCFLLLHLTQLLAPFTAAPRELLSLFSVFSVSLWPSLGSTEVPCLSFPP